jgi:RNA 3'-terminal phosphate cyclase
MDESKPSTPPSEFHLRSVSEQTAVDIDPAPARSAKASESVAIERQNRSGQIDTRRNEPSDGSSVAVYYRNEQEVRDGFLVALRAMGVADVEQLPEPAEPPVRGAKP